jgi:hypothetical protein
VEADSGHPKCDPAIAWHVLLDNAWHSYLAFEEPQVMGAGWTELSGAGNWHVYECRRACRTIVRGVFSRE